MSSDTGADDLFEFDGDNNFDDGLSEEPGVFDVCLKVSRWRSCSILARHLMQHLMHEPFVWDWRSHAWLVRRCRSSSVHPSAPQADGSIEGDASAGAFCCTSLMRQTRAAGVHIRAAAAMLAWQP